MDTYTKYERFEESFYEQAWASLNGKLSQDPDSYRSKTITNVVLKFIQYCKKHKIKGKMLDVGCGNGKNAIYFAKNGFEAHAIDISKSAVKIAKDQAKSHNVKISAKVGSALQLSHKKEFFDVIIDCGCLHHLRKTEWKTYKENILRSLKKGGHYVLSCFHESLPVQGSIRTSMKRPWSVKNGHYSYFFSEKTIRKLFRSEFEVISNSIHKKKTRKIIMHEFVLKKK